MPCALLAMAVYLARARGFVGLEASLCILAVFGFARGGASLLRLVRRPQETKRRPGAHGSFGVSQELAVATS